MRKVFLMLIGVVLLLSGCQNSVNSVESTAYGDKRVVTDSFLARRLKVLDTHMVINENGFMEAQVAAQNGQTGWFNSTDRFSVNYRFTWIDKYGRVYTDSTPTWRHRIMYAGERVYFTSVAPSAEYCDFVLEIKESDEI